LFRSRLVTLSLLASYLWTLPALGQAPAPAPAPAEPAPEAPAPEAPAPEAPAPEAPAPDAGVPEAPVPAPEAPASTPEAPAPAPEAPAPATPARAPAPVPAPVPLAPAPAPEPPSEPATTPEPTAAPEPSVPASESEPETIVVVGTRLSQTAGSAHVVGEKQLERWEYDDPHAALTSVPGVYVRQEDGMGLRPNIGLRGVNPDRAKKVTLLEDGVLFGPAPYSAPAAYYFPVLTRITQLKVTKGPGAISYGPQTVAGTVELITRPIPDQTAASADVAVGQYGYGKAHLWAGTSTDQFGVLVEGVRLQNNGFKELPDGADTGFVRNEWMVKAAYTFDPAATTRNELRIKLTYSDETSNESYLGLSDRDLEANPDRRYPVSKLDRMRNHRTSVVLTHLLEHGDDLTLTTNLYRNAFSRVWRKVNGLRNASVFDVLRNPDAPNNQYPHGLLTGQADSTSAMDAVLIGPNERDFISEGIESRLRYDANTGRLEHRVEAGVRYHHDTIDRRHSQNGFLVQGGELLPDGQATQVTAFNKGETHAVALYATDALTIAHLTLTPGLRAELIRYVYDDKLVPGGKDRDFQYAILPGLGAYYAITRELGILAGAYRGFSPPPPESAKSSDPENSINYEGGARYTDGALRVESIGFWNEYTNLTDVCTFSGGCDEANLDEQFDAGEARIVGVEAFAQHDIPAGPVKLPVLGSYTYTHSEFLTSFASADPAFGSKVQKGDQMPYVPRHQLRASAGVEHRRAGGSVAVNYVSAMREEPGQGDVQARLHTDQLITVDLAARALVWGPLSLYANVQNLLDTRSVVSHRPFGARPNAPRWVHVGAKVEY
jgi:Fe(3+) dicitrate transport protein